MKIMLANFTKMVDDSGGLSKVTCAMANELQRRGHEVTLVYSDIQEGEFFYKLNAGIPAFDLRHFRGQNIEFPRYLKAKRELLRTFSLQRARTINNDFAEKYLLKNVKILLQELQPEIIVSSQTAASKLLLCDLQTKIPVITMSHGDPEDYFLTYPKKELPSLEKSAICQVLLPSFAQHLHNHLAKVKTVIIGNVVPQYQEQADLAADKQIHKILFVGRLAENHKRPHLLIKAFAKLSKDFPDWFVELWGADEGKLYRKYLEELISKEHLEHQVFLKGVTKNIAAVLQKGDIFVIPSAYEGFPLALTEAMSMGLPVVGYRNAPAVNELIVDGQNGFLCADGIDDLADKLRKLMTEQDIRIKIGRAARESMRPYTDKSVWDTWEDLIYEVAGKGGRRA